MNSKQNECVKTEKTASVKKYSVMVLLAFYVVSLIRFLILKDLMGISVSVFSIFATISLIILNRKKERLLEDKLFIALIWYICIASVLGSGYGFYDINHYDDFLHVVSGLLSSTAAISILKYFNDEESVSKINKVFIIIYVFMFSMGVASLWEIGEFSMDNILHTNTQVGGLTDTVMDMIDAMVGSIATIICIRKKI